MWKTLNDLPERTRIEAITPNRPAPRLTPRLRSATRIRPISSPAFHAASTSCCGKWKRTMLRSGARTSAAS